LRQYWHTIKLFIKLRSTADKIFLFFGNFTFYSYYLILYLLCSNVLLGGIYDKLIIYKNVFFLIVQIRIGASYWHL